VQGTFREHSGLSGNTKDLAVVVVKHGLEERVNCGAAALARALPNAIGGSLPHEHHLGIGGDGRPIRCAQRLVAAPVTAANIQGTFRTTINLKGTFREHSGNTRHLKGTFR